MSKIEQNKEQAKEALLRELREVSAKVDIDQVREHINIIDPYFWKGPDDSLDLEAIEAHLNGNNHEDSI